MSATTFGSACIDRGCFLKDEFNFPKSKKLNQRKQFSIRSSATVTPQSLQFGKNDAQNRQKQVQIGVLGASGYTGAEIIRLLANHPYFKINLMTAERKAGEYIGSVFPHLITQDDLPKMVATKDANFSEVDAVFCCLPHGTTQDIIKALPNNLKVVDFSANFRLRNIAEYEEWYGQPHRAPELQKEAVYGLTETLREEIRDARLVANPGSNIRLLERISPVLIYFDFALDLRINIL